MIARTVNCILYGLTTDSKRFTYDEMMKAIIAVAVLCATGSGCKPTTDSPSVREKSSKPVTTQANGSATESGGSPNTITPIGPNVGAITPVAGSENLGGGTGGNLGEMAKSQARKAAKQEEAPSSSSDSDSQ